VVVAAIIGVITSIFEGEVAVVDHFKIYTGMQILAHKRDVVKIATQAVSLRNMFLLNNSILRNITHLEKLRQRSLSQK